MSKLPINKSKSQKSTHRIHNPKVVPYNDPAPTLLSTILDRESVPVIAIQGRTLHQCKKGGSILKFETQNL